MPPKGQGAKSPSMRRLAPGQKTPCILHLDSLSGGWRCLPFFLRLARPGGAPLTPFPCIFAR